MSAHLKALGLHVYLTTTKKSYVDNGKHLEANIQAMEALRHTLDKEHLSLISHCDYAFAVWNTLTSFKNKCKTFWRENQEGMNPSKRATWSKGMTPLRYIRYPS